MGLSGRGAVVDDQNPNEASQAGLIKNTLLVENSSFPRPRLNNPLTRPGTVSKDFGGAAVGDDRVYQAATSVRNIAAGSRHIVELQSLRGIAASIVVVFIVLSITTLRLSLELSETSSSTDKGLLCFFSS